MPSSRKRIALAIGLGIVTSGLVTAPASANPTGTGLVISEVYGGGGNSSATYTHDFIELYNPTGDAISVAGMSVQYRSTSGTSVGANITGLSGSVPSGGHYLVQEASNAAVGAALPTPDASGTISMAAGSGQVLLVNGTGASTVGTGDLAGNPNLVDMVGYGTAGSFEGAATGVLLTSSTSAFRNATPLDSDNNANDFAEALPTPQGQGGVTPPPDEFEGSIAEIQGTDTATSPHVGDIATTTGVVTAAYPTGGYNGFYIQTPGTGGPSDATPGASDGLFVYGSAATAAIAPGDHVEVVGLVKEFSGTTEIETDAASDVTVLSDVVTAPTPLATTLPATESAREAHEGEVLAPTGPFTVTNTYSTNQYAEIGLAAGTTPLIAPTEIRDAQDTAGVAEVTADNAARAITLDDGASLNFLSAANQATPLPWLATTNPIRVGAPVTFTGPVVLEYRNSVWKFQPTSRVTGTGAGTATFVNTRTEAPESVGGDIRLATFNVLNYFPTTGAEFVSSGLGTCTFYNDRDGNPITNNTCTNNGPRGAANEANLARQQVKIVTAINKLGASIVSLEELENSVQFGKSRDFAISRLVDALNTAAGSDVWDFAPSPAAADLPAPSQEDVIRTGFIFKPADVELVGASEVLIDEENFDNAREPLAQAFRLTGTTDADAFAVIVNHFKSKGSGTDDGTGQGNSNPDRIGQAHALSAFADSFATDRGTDAMFLAGDFNSYSMEDPIQVLEADGFTRIESDTEGEETYSFSGLSGSLDHMFANDAGLAMVTGADIWNINSGEALAFEYSRHNYNVTDFYQENQFRASDHDPEIVGIDVPGFPVDPPDGPVDTATSATSAPMTYGTPGSVAVTVTSTQPVTGTVEVLDGTTSLGTDDVASDGTATVAIAGTALEPGSHTLTIRYSGDAANKPSTGTVTVVVAKATPTVSSTVSPTRVVVDEGTTTATATVAAEGFEPGGTVVFSVDGVEAGEAMLEDGTASLVLGPFATTGDRTVTATYSGDDHTASGASSSTVEVVGHESVVKVKATPKKVVADKTRVKLHITVASDGPTPTGTVTVKAGGETYVVKLRNGKADVRLKKFGSKGTKSVTVTYSGDDQTEGSSKRIEIDVDKKKHKK